MKKSTVIALHFLYWGSYVLLLMFIYTLFRQAQPGGGRAPSHHGGEGVPYILFTKMFLGLAVVPALTSFYSSYSILFPKYVSKKKIGLFFLYGILTLLISGLLGEITLTVLLGGVGDGSTDFIFPNYNPAEILVAIFLSCMTGLVHGVIGLTIKGFITSYNDIKLKEELSTKNYETELALMKAQINPHFLFNTINNIDVLIQKDAAKASEYLNKLSDIMRFMLYETKTEKISLAKEIAYIDKYIELQKIRTANPNYINYKVEGNTDSLVIEPMLFIPFMENAFKHAENKKTENAITIHISVEKDKIKFTCENHYTVNPAVKLEHSGLGNDLIERRLALLYPNKHSFKIDTTNGVYKVNLVLSI